MIYYHMKEPAVTVLGPGTRYVLWVQGCHKSCPGCIAPNSRNMQEGKTIKPSALAWEIALSHADGLTISGGEPFLQSEALADMLDILQPIRNMGVIVFTGYTYEELLTMPSAQKLLSRIDLLIDGEYIQELNDHRGLRGSRNQRYICLTDRYKEDVSALENCQREQQVFHHGIEIHYVGIPGSKGDYDPI